MVALSELAVDIVASGDEARFRDLMEAHHYLGALPGNRDFHAPASLRADTSAQRNSSQRVSAAYRLLGHQGIVVKHAGVFQSVSMGRKIVFTFIHPPRCR